MIGLIVLFALPAQAQVVQRASIITNGGLTFTGNALGLDGDARENGQGTRGAIGTFITTDTTLQDITPPAASAPAFPPGTTSDWRLNGSAARLRLPPGARVVYAELIWGGTPAGSRPEDNVIPFLDDPVLFTTPAGVSAVTPDPATAFVVGNITNRGTCNACYYVRSADVTALVAAAGAGFYTTGRVPGTQGTTDNNNNSAGWTLAVIYQDLTAPIRSLTLFVGLDKSGGNSEQLSGFCTAPVGPVKARLALSAVDGDARSTGDNLLFGSTKNLSSGNRLSGPRNPATNFFAGQITDDLGNLDTAGTFGARNHTPGVPLVGARQSWDITNVDASAQMTNSQTTAFTRGTSNGDSYQITAFGLQVDVGGPRFSSASGTMTVDRATAVIGDVLTYTIVLDNAAGTADANNTVFIDAPPAGTSLVAGSFTVNGIALPAANPSVGVPIGVIPAGAKTTVGFQVRVDSIPTGTSPQLRTNQARWTFDFATCAGQPAQSGAGQSNSVATVVPVADLSIAASASAQAVAGSPVTGQIVVTNNGPSPVSGAVVASTGTTPLLTNATWTCTAPPGAACVPATGTGRVSSTITLPVGSAITFRVTGTVPPSTPAGTLSTTVTVTASAAVPDFNGANNAATASAPVVTRSDVAITNTGPGTVSRGGTAVFTIAVTNRGPSDAANVLINDPTPVGLTLVSFTGPCVVAPGCSLPAGTTQTATATFAIPAGYAGPDPIANVATVTTTTTDPNAANNSARATAALNAPVADVSVTHSDNVTQVSAGATTTYTITVRNAGPASAPGTRVVDTFDPATYTDVHWQCVASGTSSCAATGVQAGNIDTLVTIEPGNANAVVLTAQARIRSDATGTAENTATVDAPSTVNDPTSANDIATDVDTIRVVADLSIAVSGPAVIVPGTTASYTITVSNAGPSTARALSFVEAPEESVAVPAGVAGPGLIDSIQAPPDAVCLSGPRVSATGVAETAPTCTIAVLPPLATRTFSVRLTIPPDYPQGVSPAALLLRNSLTLDADVDDDPTGGDRTAVTTATIGAQADVAVSVIGPASIVAGAVASYFIQVGNSGPSTATNVVIQNPVPAGLTIVGSDGPCAGGFPCTQAALAPGDDNTTRIDVLVPNNYQGPPSFVETASVRSDSRDLDAANDAQSVTTFVVPEQADLSIVVTAPTVVMPGAPRTYVGRVTNVGPGPALNITVADVLPGGAVFIGGSAPPPPTTCSIPAAGTSDLISCLTPSLAVDGVLDFRLTVQSGADLVPGALLTNVGSVSAPTPDLHSANDRSVVVTRVATADEAELTVQMTDAPDPVIAGSTVTYTILVTNVGPAAATNVTLTDTLPPGFAIVSATPDQGACAGATCALGTMAPSTTATVRVVATPSATGLFTNAATVSAAETDPVPDNNTVSEPTTVATADQADLVIEKFGPTLMAPGESSFYSIEILNRGPADAVNVEVGDPLPAGFTFITNTGDCVTAFPCEFESLEAGGSRRIVTTFTVDPSFAAPGAGVNTATIASTATGDPDPSNNSSSLTTTVYPAGSADLFVTNLESPNPVFTGAEMSYFLSVGNRGPSGAAGVTLTDILPPGIHVISVRSTLGTCAGSSIVTCRLGDMPAGSLARVGILATAPTLVPVPNPMLSTATVTSRAPDSDPGNNQSIASTTVVPPLPPNAADLSIAIAGPASVRRGQTLAYTLTILNAGPSPASTVVVDNPAPPGLTFVSVSGDCTSVLPCDLGALAPGQRRVVVASFAVPANYSGANPIVETGSVSTPTFDPVLTNNVATVHTLAGVDVRNEGCSVGSVRSVGSTSSAAPVVSGAPTRLADFLPDGPAFGGGTSVACGDVNGDGIAELITGPGPGAPPIVRVWSLSGAGVTEIAHFFAYDPGFVGGVSVAAGDVTGDGVAEIVTGAGPGGGPHVRVWRLSSGSVSEIAGFFAYDVAFAGGVSVAAGDLTGDGVAEIVTGAGPGGGPHVRVWTVTGRGATEIAGFFAYDDAFPGGVSVAVGDVTGDGAAEIVTGPGPGGAPEVRVWTLSGRGAIELTAFPVYAPAFTGGVHVAVGDLTGDGVAELVSAAGPGGASHVRVWSLLDARIRELAGFFAYDLAFAGGASVAIGDVNGDGIAELITGSGPGGQSSVRVWTFDGARVRELAGFFPYDPAFPGGVAVAAGDVTGDGIADVITGPGPGGAPQVRSWRMTGGTETARSGFFAYAPAFTGGVSVAVGDVTGDGVAELVTGAGPGGGPDVRVWSLRGGGPPTQIASFFAYDQAFRGGVSVAVGDLTGDGVAEIVTGAGPGGGPHVRVWSVSGGRVTEMASFFAFDSAFAGGVSVAAGDLDGDGVAELVTAAGFFGGSRVRVWRLKGGAVSAITQFSAYDPSLPGAVSVAVGDLTGDGIAELVTGAGFGGSPDVRVWSVSGGTVTALARFTAYDSRFGGGLSVAVGDIDGDGVGEIITGAGPGGGPHVRIWSVSGAAFTVRPAPGAGGSTFALRTGGANASSRDWPPSPVPAGPRAHRRRRRRTAMSCGFAALRTANVSAML